MCRRPWQCCPHPAPGATAVWRRCRERLLHYVAMPSRIGLLRPRPHQRQLARRRTIPATTARPLSNSTQPAGSGAAGTCPLSASCPLFRLPMACAKRTSGLAATGTRVSLDSISLPTPGIRPAPSGGPSVARDDAGSTKLAIRTRECAATTVPTGSDCEAEPGSPDCGGATARTAPGAIVATQAMNSSSLFIIFFNRAVFFFPRPTSSKMLVSRAISRLSG